MTLMKAFFLVALVMSAWTALVGVSTASAADEVVLCRSLTEKGSLCPEGENLPAGTKVLALAANQEAKTSFGTVKCADSVFVAETAASMGGSLPLKITSWEFGKLPTPKLGEGCTSCTGGIHSSSPYIAIVEVLENDDYSLKFSGSFVLLNCFGLGLTCIYAVVNSKSSIASDAGFHLAAPEGRGLAYILINTTLEKLAGSSGFCPTTAAWTAIFVVYTLEVEGQNAQGWLALYEHL
jgi:hypothetical protein